MDFKELIKITEDRIKRFEKIEGRKWGVEGAMIELSKQVGDLSKFIMMYEKYYFSDRDKLDKQYEADKEKIGDELADILFAIIRIARHYGIDLEEAHLKEKKAEDEFFKKRKSFRIGYKNLNSCE